MTDKERPSAEEILATMQEYLEEKKDQALALVYGHTYLVVCEAQGFDYKKQAAEILVERVFQALEAGATHEEIIEKVRAVKPPNNNTPR